MEGGGGDGGLRWVVGALPPPLPVAVAPSPMPSKRSSRRRRHQENRRRLAEASREVAMREENSQCVPIRAHECVCSCDASVWCLWWGLHMRIDTHVQFARAYLCGAVCAGPRLR